MQYQIVKYELISDSVKRTKNRTIIIFRTKNHFNSKLRVTRREKRELKIIYTIDVIKV